TCALPIWKLVELTASLLRLTNQTANGTVRLTERCTTLNQVVRQVSGHHPRVERTLHALRHESQLLHSARNCRQHHEHGVYCIEQRTLVVLQILVVTAWQSLERGKQRREGAEGACGGAACQFQRVGVSLLRHHAGAGGEAVAETHEAEFA